MSTAMRYVSRVSHCLLFSQLSRYGRSLTDCCRWPGPVLISHCCLFALLTSHHWRKWWTAVWLGLIRWAALISSTE